MTDETAGYGAPLEAFVARDFEAWSGLAPGTPLDVVVARFGADPERFARRLIGARPWETFYIPADVDGYPRLVRIWYRSDEVVMLSTEHPNLDVAGLGEPEARLDTTADVVEVPGGEWVYPDRGIAVSFAPGGSVVAELAVFPPTTLDAYVDELRRDTTLIERPAPDRPTWADEPDLDV